MTDSRETTPGWVEHYRQRTVNHEAAIAKISPGDSVFSTLGHNVDSIVAGLIGRGIPISFTITTGPDLDWLTPDLAENFRINTYFATVGSRDALNAFLGDYTPWWVWGAHKALEEGRRGAKTIDVSLVRVSPPNNAGWCCLGNSLWDVRTTASYAKTTIAVVSDDVMHTFGDTWIPATDIDWFVEEEPATPPDAESAARWRNHLLAQADDTTNSAIAGHIAALVRDGDAIQIGTGTTTSSLVISGALDAKNDLGYFAELAVPGAIDLALRGVITSKYLARHPGRFVTTMAVGLPHETAALNENPMFEFYGVDYVHNPTAIAKNDNLIAVNQALTVDLTGQIAAGQFGSKIWSGTGGQFSYALGAFMSKGGRSVTVIPSTAQKGTVSRIVAEMPQGQIVTIPRDIADTVVTEYGVAELLNKTQKERAWALIEIAHPEFRDDLRSEAKRLFGA
ncbi:MAG TPA: acetyl-CoA hydrolase/transferase C-terminal domain-containing protein [Chloroflexota bacterium]|jgi:4-hydroxybutyrate CoA-transferase|nr:acetyl-CoA hydrolase/transferase C-terminal domain-containing protein [Chloroflexota bacterium]